MPSEYNNPTTITADESHPAVQFEFLASGETEVVDQSMMAPAQADDMQVEPLALESVYHPTAATATVAGGNHRNPMQLQRLDSDLTAPAPENLPLPPVLVFPKDQVLEDEPFLFFLVGRGGKTNAQEGCRWVRDVLPQYAADYLSVAKSMRDAKAEEIYYNHFHGHIIFVIGKDYLFKNWAKMSPLRRNSILAQHGGRGAIASCQNDDRVDYLAVGLAYTKEVFKKLLSAAARQSGLNSQAVARPVPTTPSPSLTVNATTVTPFTATGEAAVRPVVSYDEDEDRLLTRLEQNSLPQKAVRRLSEQLEVDLQTGGSQAVFFAEAGGKRLFPLVNAVVDESGQTTTPPTTSTTTNNIDDIDDQSTTSLQLMQEILDGEEDWSMTGV